MSLLADLLVMFRVEGKDQLDAATAASRKGLEGVAETAGKAGGGMTDAMRAGGEAVDAAAERMHAFMAAASKSVDISWNVEAPPAASPAPTASPATPADAERAERLRGATQGNWALQPPPVRGGGGRDSEEKEGEGFARPFLEGFKKGLKNPFKTLWELLTKPMTQFGKADKPTAGGAKKTQDESPSLLQHLWDRLVKPLASAVKGGGAAGGEAGAGAVAGGVAEAAGGLAALAAVGVGAAVVVKGLSAAWETFTGVLQAGVNTFFDLIKTGLSLSAMGQVLDFQWQQLARTVAGMFGPEIQLVIGWVQKLTEAFDRIAKSEGFGKLMSLVDQVMDFLGGVIVGFVDMIGGLLDALAPLFDALGAKADHKERGQMSMRVGGPEAPEAIWDRLAKASVMGTAGKSVEEQQLDEQKATTQAAKDTTAAVKGIKPAFR